MREVTSAYAGRPLSRVFSARLRPDAGSEAWHDGECRVRNERRKLMAARCARRFRTCRRADRDTNESNFC